MNGDLGSNSYSERLSRGRVIKRRVTRRFKGSAENRRIAVLMGGVSRERAISLKSGKAVVEALEAAGRSVTPVLINRADERALEDLPSDTEVAFIALHGRFGEDGGIQRQLAERGIPFTGAGPLASALAFDKIATKERLRANGVPTPNAVILRQPWSKLAARQALEAVRKFPVVVKPSKEGSSIGITIARSRVEAEQAIERSRRFNDDMLLEDFIPGREMTVPIFRGLQLPIVEMITDKAFFDFHAKYQDPNTSYKVSPELPPDTQGRIFAAARRAHEVVGCDPFSRVDIRLDPDGRPWVLEINTIPGLTATSLLPKAAAQLGIDFAQLCLLMVENAAVRGPQGVREKSGAMRRPGR